MDTIDLQETREIITGKERAASEEEAQVQGLQKILRPQGTLGLFHSSNAPGLPGESAEFHLGHGDMIRLLRGCGLEVLDLLELQPGPGATTRYPFVSLEWARQWPCEEVWKARKRS